MFYPTPLGYTQGLELLLERERRVRHDGDRVRAAGQQRPERRALVDGPDEEVARRPPPGRGRSGGEEAGARARRRSRE